MVMLMEVHVYMELDDAHVYVQAQMSVDEAIDEAMLGMEQVHTMHTF